MKNVQEIHKICGQVRCDNFREIPSITSVTVTVLLEMQILNPKTIFDIRVNERLTKF